MQHANGTPVRRFQAYGSLWLRNIRNRTQPNPTAAAWKANMIQRLSTKELFAASLRELAATKPLNRITVQNIAQNCGYSTATFYRMFRDKYDLIAWDYTHDLSRIMSKIGIDSCEWGDILREGAYNFMSDREYVVNMLQHTAGTDSFEDLMIRQNYEILHQYALDLSGQDALSKNVELCMRTYCMGTVRLCCDWIKGVFQAEPAEIADVCESAMPRPLYPYLYDCK